MLSYYNENLQNTATSGFDGRPVRLWALIDLLTTGPLLIPASALWLVSVVSQISNLLGLQMFVPDFDGLHLFFVCLAGALGVLWALVRLLWPQANLSLADSLGRLWVAGLIAVLIIGHGLPQILWAFVLTELAGALHQGWNLLRYRAKNMQTGPAAGTAPP